MECRYAPTIISLMARWFDVSVKMDPWLECMRISESTPSTMVSGGVAHFSNILHSQRRDKCPICFKFLKEIRLSDFRSLNTCNIIHEHRFVFFPSFLLHVESSNFVSVGIAACIFFHRVNHFLCKESCHCSIIECQKFCFVCNGKDGTLTFGWLFACNIIIEKYQFTKIFTSLVGCNFERL